ncbi:MAG: ABC transporter substrate-binding protein [Halieaceae bacterium]|nr:ABC transporter substrate-binding protein [Halieaceae bacterium]
MTVLLRKFAYFVLLATVLCPLALAQEPAGEDAYQVIERTTDRVMTLVQEANAYADEDPERYFNELQTVLDEVVDFAYFSRAVMGPYASRKRYQSLSDEGKQELRGQVTRFTEVMRDGLVRTYGKGLLAFGGSRAEIQRPDGSQELGNRAEIRQLIYSDAPDPYVIEYQMRKGKDGQWRLRNLIVETINLGVIYRNQFQAAARDADGDINYVIDNWTTPEGEAEAG